jgi:hypothetical protein
LAEKSNFGAFLWLLECRVVAIVFRQTPRLARTMRRDTIAFPEETTWKLQSEYSLRGITPKGPSKSYCSEACLKNPWFS